MPVGWRRLAQVAPFVAMGVGMGVVTVWWERYHQGTQGQLFQIPWLDRVLIASRAVWFYAGKLLWPANLAFSYPRWTIAASDPAAYGWVLATAALGVAVWRARRWTGRSVEVAAAFFAATLSPVLGFIMLYTFAYSFVADHDQYVACLGPITLAAAGIEHGLGRMAKAKPVLRPLLCAGLPLMLAALTWHQCGQYADIETLWLTTLAHNPACWLARNNLGSGLAVKGELDAAIAQYRKALETKPDYMMARNNLGDALLAKGDLDAAIAQYQKALETEINAGSADTCLHLGLAYMQKGQTKEALDCWEKSLALKPGQPFVQNNLAWALATTYDASLRDGARAMALATQANQASGGGDPEILHTLAAACAEAGNYDQAAITARRALDLAVAQKNGALAAALQKEIQLYQANTPMRDGPR